MKKDPLVGHCFVKKLVDTHTNGCNPAPAQHAAVLARRGGTWLNIPLPLLVTLRVLFQSRTKPSAIRDLLREHRAVPDSEPIYAQTMINMKMKLFKLGNNLDKWEASHFGKETVEPEDRKTLARFAREWVQDHMNEDNGSNILIFLEELKNKYPGFQYRYARDVNKCLSAWMFMTAEMQYFAEQYGQVLFLDWMKSGVSDVDWPYQGCVVLDEELSVHIVAHTLACTESNDSYKFSLNSMTSIVPELHKITKVTFSDRLASEDTFFQCLRSLELAALCNWHLRAKNLAEWVRFHPQQSSICSQFMWKIQNALVSPDQLQINIKEFKQEWGGQAACFMSAVEPEIHRFCAAYTHQHLLLFQTGNSSGESGNSSVDAFLTENKPHSELVATLVQYDAEQSNRERRELAVMQLKLPSRLKEIIDPDTRACLKKFSDIITKKFQEQLNESTKYTATFLEQGGGYFEVRREGHPQSSRKVTRDTDTLLFICPCLTRKSSGCSCRHIICVLSKVGEPLFHADYFHPRWARRFDLPSPEEIVEKFTLLRNISNGPHVTMASDAKTMSEADAVEFEGSVCPDPAADTNMPDCTIPAFLSQKDKRTKLQKNFHCVMEEARKLAEFTQTSSELSEIAAKSIQLLHADLRAGQKPDLSNFETRVGEMFSTGHGGEGSIDDTTIAGKSSLGMPGPKKRTRIRAASELHGPAKKARKAKAIHQQCRICTGNDCAPRFCRTLARHGQIIVPDREHGYDNLLSLEIPLISAVEQVDYTTAPFDNSWDFVVLQRMFRDDKGYKYVRIFSLDKTLQISQTNLLYTFTALLHWLSTKPKRKHILLQTDVTYPILTGERFIRPQNVLRFNAAIVDAATHAKDVPV